MRAYVSIGELIFKYLLYSGLKVVFRRNKVVPNDLNTKYHSKWTMGTEIPCVSCLFHTGYIAHGNNKDDTKGKSTRIE